MWLGPCSIYLPIIRYLRIPLSSYAIELHNNNTSFNQSAIVFSFSPLHSEFISFPCFYSLNVFCLFHRYLATSSSSNVGGKALDFKYTPAPAKGQAMWPTRFEDYGYGDDQILRSSRVMMLEANQRGMKIMLVAIFIVSVFSFLATIIPKL